MLHTHLNRGAVAQPMQEPMQAPPQMYPQQMPPMVQEAPQLAQAPANPWGGQARNSRIFFPRAISISVAAGGSGYTRSPVVVFTGGGASAATATAVVARAVISSIIVTNVSTLVY